MSLLFLGALGISAFLISGRLIFHDSFALLEPFTESSAVELATIYADNQPLGGSEQGAIYET
jgi:hypothetical protein